MTAEVQEEHTQCLTAMTVSVTVTLFLYKSIKQIFTVYRLSLHQLLPLSACSVWESAGSGTRDVLEDNKDTSGFSEHELLDIMYNACNTSSTGTQAYD